MRGARQIFPALGFLLANLFLPPPLSAAETTPAWQTEWEKTVKAAEQEGQAVVYMSGYEAVLASGIFQKAYPKIRVVSVTGSGTQLAPRIASERRAGKYLADVYNGGGNSLYQILYVGKMLDPIKRALILPEVVDESKWWEGKHKYVDPEGAYVFVYEGNVSGGGGPSYNSKFLNPKDYKSYWDFLDPKLKGKIVAADLRQVRGAGLGWQYLYYHPQLGPAYLKRLYGEMDVTMSADLRQAVDWMATGKWLSAFPARAPAWRAREIRDSPWISSSPSILSQNCSTKSSRGKNRATARLKRPARFRADMLCLE
jgi:hypothetical protein